MFQQQLILRQHPLLQLGELLLILFLQGIDLIHKVQFLQVKGLLVILLRQEDKLLVLVVLVVRDVCLDELVQRVDVLTGERDLVVCAVALVALLLLFLYGLVQLLQVDHLRRGVVLVLHVPDQLKTLLDVLLVHELVLLQDLLDSGNSKNLLLECADSRLGAGFADLEVGRWLGRVVRRVARLLGGVL